MGGLSIFWKKVEQHELNIKISIAILYTLYSERQKFPIIIAILDKQSYSKGTKDTENLALKFLSLSSKGYHKG